MTSNFFFESFNSKDSDSESSLGSITKKLGSKKKYLQLDYETLENIITKEIEEGFKVDLNIKIEKGNFFIKFYSG